MQTIGSCHWLLSVAVPPELKDCVPVSPLLTILLSERQTSQIYLVDGKQAIEIDMLVVVQIDN